MNFQTELAFLKLAENLKGELRHAWLSDGVRQESVAEHSWRLALMALRYADKLDQKVNLEKCLALALVHDFGEVEAGDVCVLDAQTHEAQIKKYQAEEAAMINVKNLLKDKNGDAIFALWQEYEDQQTYESKFIKALDKLEVWIQHNEAPLSTWDAREKLMVFQDKWLKKYTAFDSYLNRFADAVLQVAIDRLIAAGDDIEAIRKEALARGMI